MSAATVPGGAVFEARIVGHDDQVIATLWLAPGAVGRRLHVVVPRPVRIEDVDLDAEATSPTFDEADAVLDRVESELQTVACNRYHDGPPILVYRVVGAAT